MQQHSAPRWEFRVFASALGGIAAVIETSARSTSEDAGHETYVLSRRKPETNVKLRDGQLEVKELIDRAAGLELWRPSFRSGFPIPSDVLASEVVHPLGFAAWARIDLRDENALRTRLQAEPDIAIVDIAKHRRRFDLDRRALAEHVRLEVCGRTAETVAVESGDREVVEDLVRRFRLGCFENRSYPAWLAGLTRA